MVYRNQEPDKDCFTPRSYQIELVEKAKQRNIIVPLGTGSGKTFIAVLLIKELADTLRLPWENGGKRTFFLVNTVALVGQHAEQIRVHTDLTVGEFHGGKNVDLWSSDAWEKHFAANQVLVMTSAIFQDVLNHGFMDLSRVNLLVFDECHHAVKDHPYKKIMDAYYQLKQQQEKDGLPPNRPRVLGLSASIVNETCKASQLERFMQQLENNLHCRIETADDMVCVAKYGAKPKILLIECKNFNCKHEALCRSVHQQLTDAKRFCMDANFHPELDIDPTKTVIEAFTKSLNLLQQLGPWGAWKVSKLWVNQLKKMSRERGCVLTDMEQQFIWMAQTQLHTASTRFDRMMKQVKTVEDLMRFVPDKVARLLEILKQCKPTPVDDAKPQVQLPPRPPEPRRYGAPRPPRRRENNFSGSEFSGIIFVEQRCVAYILSHLIKFAAKLSPDDFDYLRPDFVIGSSGHLQSEEEQLSLHKRQEEVLRSFRLKKLNLLIATSVLEEGIDVRQCNCVIRFDRPQGYRNYIQSKGRARKAGSHFFVLFEEDHKGKIKEDFEEFFKIEQILLSHCSTRGNPAPLDLNEADLADADKLVPPYEPPIPPGSTIEAQPRVSMSTAIALVNRYCAKLPSDIFTRLTPTSTIEEVHVNGCTLYQAKVMLPINSPLKPVIKNPLPMRTKKLAQMAVALEVCKRLHQCGELDDHLLPVGKEQVMKLLDEIGEDEIWTPGSRARPGSSKRKQYYDKRVPLALQDCQPIVGKPCYLHVFHMKLTVPATGQCNPKNRTPVDPDDASRCFAMLSANLLPNLPSFPVYTRQGEVQVRVWTCPNTVCLSLEQLSVIEKFHHYVFGTILHLDKFNLSFNPVEAPHNTFIVPVLKEGGTCVLDYNFIVRTVNETEDFLKEPDDRDGFVFDANNYNDAIVVPWYRNFEQPHYYYLADILEDKHPDCSFPDEEFSSYNDYFMMKYGVFINNQDQPLFDVDYTSNRLNLLVPRFRNRRGQLLRSLDDRQPAMSQRQILIPELVVVHPIPASLWNMITNLPTVLYRVNYMLLADELRSKVQQEGGLGPSQPPPGHQWVPLDYGWSKTMQKAQRAKDIASSSSAPVNVQEIGDPGDGGEELDDFPEIGVWDPSEAAGLDVSDRRDVTLEPMVADAAGLSLQVGVHNDSDEDEEEIFFDTQFSRRMRLLQGVPPADTADPVTPSSGGSPVPLNGIRPSPNLFQPSVNIEPSGWDTNESFTGTIDVQSDAVLGGVQVLSVPGNAFNASALSQDLQTWEQHTRGTAAAVVPTPPAVVADVNDITEVNQNGHGAEKDDELPEACSCPGVHQKKDEPEASQKRKSDGVAEEGNANKQSKKNYESRIKHGLLDAIEMLDDADKTVARDCVDFEQTDDDDIASNVSTSKSSVEIGGFIKSVDDLKLQMKDDKPVLPKEEEEPSDMDDEYDECGATVDWSVAKPKQVTVEDIFEPGLISFEQECRNIYGPNPATILQALTMSSACDGINLERLETVGDSFLKYAVTVFLFLTQPTLHEGKLSFARSKQVSNFTLYRLARKKGLGEIMVQTKFEPHDNWLPPGYVVGKEMIAENETNVDEEDVKMDMALQGETTLEESTVPLDPAWGDNEVTTETTEGVEVIDLNSINNAAGWMTDGTTAVLACSMETQHSLADKSLADCVEALIGVYLIECGIHSTLMFMSWMGLKVLPENSKPFVIETSPLLEYIENPRQSLTNLYYKHNFPHLEETIGYSFKEKAYLIQAFTHATYHFNRVTECYQRLEFLGDAVLDYVITRHLYEDSRRHSPGVLTDLRSALVNNTIFASLALKYNFHKYFLAICPPLNFVMEKFANLYKEKKKEANFDEELYLLGEDEADGEEDVEVPKALGDIFESVAGAIYLDSGGSLDTVWRVFYRLMKEQLEKCVRNPPKSPIRELLELEPENAKFSKLERLVFERKVRVTVDVAGKCRCAGTGRNYRIAKCTAAKRALRYLKQLNKQRARSK